MQVGRALYQFSRRPRLVALSVAIAALAAMFSAYRISLLPPSLHPRAIGMASASTQILVDNPYTIVLDLNQGSYQLQQMAQSATLLGNVLGSVSVRTEIARIAGVPVKAINTTEPATPQFPQAITLPRNRTTTDLLASNNQYRINIQANPTVPILTIYTEAHSTAVAKALANAAATGLRDYMNSVAPSLPAKKQIQIEQLGQAQGGAVTGGLRVEVLGLVFGFALLITGGILLAIDRIVRGWRMAKGAAGPTTVAPTDVEDVADRPRPPQAGRLARRARPG
ncbi:MAG TPA: hypothetical protein VG294_03070 [Solirubrobacteraceae bacterium]|nr:hypothetical protein [Solirubrobacteraceae bacterium]